MQTLLKSRNKIKFEEDLFIAIVLDKKESEWIKRNDEDVMKHLMLNVLEETIISKKKRYNKQVIIFDCEKKEIFRK